MGVSEQGLSNWMHGSRSPSLDNYFKIQAFLKKQRNRRKSTR
jgi:Helix-turn-helix.